jgi:hypothetical protein
VKSPNTQKFTAFVGIDWADTKHDICLQESGSDRREFGCIEHQVQCIDEWANSLHRRFGAPIAIALELAKGPIVYAAATPSHLGLRGELRPRGRE